MPTASLDLPMPDLTRQVSVHLLDDPQEWLSFSRLDAKNTGCWDSNLMIEGMHCAACALTIEDVLLGVLGVVKAEVSAGSHRARVVWSADVVLPLTGCGRLRRLAIAPCRLMTLLLAKDDLPNRAKRCGDWRWQGCA